MTDLIVGESEKLVINDEVEGLAVLGRCGACLTLSASDDDCQALTCEEAANRQWVRCGQCRSGTHDYWRRS